MGAPTSQASSVAPPSVTFRYVPNSCRQSQRAMGALDADVKFIAAAARCQKWCVQLLDKNAAILHRRRKGVVRRISCAFSFHHVRRVDVLLGSSNIDLRTAKAARPAVWYLCRQLAACVPHGVLPRLARTVLPVLN